MKIGIVTIYEPITNLGSYLQAYSMYKLLESFGHEVKMIQNKSSFKTYTDHVLKINPKRELLLRIIKGAKFLKDISVFNLLDKKYINEEHFDCLIYGSDEIWNYEYSYFTDDLFWGIGISKDVKKIAYAISVGPVQKEDLLSRDRYTEAVKDYSVILPRDENTKSIVDTLLHKTHDIVCDPTLLVDVTNLSAPITVPSKKYLLVYTYGVNPPLIKVITEYAKRNGLLIVSPCFWHLWADKIVECSALQFSTLIKHAECVFTSTFHGAIFTLLNHKKCCIFPTREKVRDIVCRLGESAHLIDENISLSDFEKIMSIEFDDKIFEDRLLQLREFSLSKLQSALNS